MEAWFSHGRNDHDLIKSLGLFGVALTTGLGLGSLAGGLFARFAALASIIFGWGILATVAASLIMSPEQGAGEAGAGRASGGKQPAGGSRYLWAGWLANLATWITIGMIR